MFRLDKRKIFLLYQYYLLGKVQKVEEEDKKAKERVLWLANCCEEEKYLGEKITKKLKTGWDFSRLPPLERAILVYAAYELLFGKNANLGEMIIAQTINFSKAYLETGKHRYINKVLDLIKEEKALN